MSLAIDVSNHNGVINWNKTYADLVRTGWAKATEGVSFLDAYLRENMKGMRRVGIHDGYYHFARPAVGNAKRQADWYVDSVLRAGGFGKLAPVLDIEVTGGLTKSQLTTWMQTWLQRVGERTGRVPVIYCSTSFAKERFDSRKFSRYPLWLASYGVSSPKVPPGWSKWDYWQYSDKGHVDGINGYVDMDYIAGEVPKMAQTLMQGSSGDAVKTLQANLKRLLGLGDKFVVDGQYGRATAAAVKSFQLQHHLVVDGIAGPQTLSAIASALPKTPSYKPVKVQFNGEDKQRGIGVVTNGTDETYIRVSDAKTVLDSVPTNAILQYQGVDYVPWIVLHTLPDCKAVAIDGGFNFTWTVNTQPANNPQVATVSVDKSQLLALQTQLQTTLSEVQKILGGN